MPEINRIICGDAATEMANLPNDSVDLIIADPPYNLGKDYGNQSDSQTWLDYFNFTQCWLAQAVRILKPTGSIYIFMGYRFISRLHVLLEDTFHLHFNSWITWHYTQGMGRKQGFSPRHEDILFFTKSQTFTFNLEAIRIPQKYYRKRNNMAGANPGDVWQFSHVHYSNPERLDHPTQKPEALIERIIRASSNEDEVILDPFVGSGTTCYVAQALHRRWLGIEANPEYVTIANNRMAQPFSQFDSIDPRVTRIPQNLPKIGGNVNEYDYQ